MKSSKLQKYTVFYENSEEYHQLKREIFSQDMYYFESDSPAPVIIDAGAHIGLSTLYFKQIFTGAKITAIEPNPESFKFLEKNIFENQLADVTAINAALSTESGQKTFFRDKTSEKWHSTASFIKGSWAGTQKSEGFEVQTHTLAEFVTQPIDFLKMDIEGFEQLVLTASRESLPVIKKMAIEFHPHKSQSLKKLVELIEETHQVEIFSGTKQVSVKKAKGLVLIVATRR